jgi:hypothetical protein
MPSVNGNAQQPSVTTSNTAQLSSNNGTQLSSTQHQSASPFGQSINTLLASGNSIMAYNGSTSTQSPFVSIAMDYKLRKMLTDKLNELKDKVKASIGADSIDNNRDFLTTYEDIHRYLTYAGLQNIVASPNETYNFDHADILENMIRQIFSLDNAHSMIIQGKQATKFNQAVPNDIPHPYYLWTAITDHFRLTPQLFEDLRAELTNLQWGGPEKITDMRGLHAFVITRAHLLQSSVARQHSAIAMNDTQLFCALNSMLNHDNSPYRDAWMNEYRKVVDADITVKYNKLLQFIRDTQIMENERKTNARRSIKAKLPTMVSTQLESDQPFTLASSGSNVMNTEYETYLAEGDQDEECQDDNDVYTLYTRSHNHYHAQQHNKKARHHYNRHQHDTNFQHKAPVENNHPVAQYINQIPPKVNYNPRTYDHNQAKSAHAKYTPPSQYPKQATQQETPQPQYNSQYVGPPPQQYNSKYTGSPPPTYTPMHPTYISQPSQQQLQPLPTSTTAVVYHEALPLHYQNAPGYPSSYPSTPPMYQYAQTPPHQPQPQQYTHQYTQPYQQPHQQSPPQQYPPQHHQQNQQHRHQHHSSKHQQTQRPMIPTNNQYLPQVNNSQTSKQRPLTQYDRSAFYTEEIPAEISTDNTQDWNSQHMETFVMPTYAPDPSTPMQPQMQSMQTFQSQPQDHSP